MRSIEADRVVCASSDPHLTFRAIFTTREGSAPRGSFTTEMQLNDTLGRAYFAVVKPFRCLTIPPLVAAPFPGKAVDERPRQRDR